MWILYMEVASIVKGSGVGITLEGRNGVTIELSLCFAFKANNN